MNRLQQLQQKLEAIPSKRKQSTLVSALARYSSRVGAAAATLAQSTESEIHVRTVFPDLVTGSAEENRGKAKRVAVRLEKRLSSNIHAVEDSRTDSEVSDLTSYASKAEESVRTRWKGALTTKLQGYEALVTAASQAGLSGDRTAMMALTYLKAQTDPPATIAAVESIRASLEKLTESVADLGLEGEAGKFLVAAAGGRGDPRALQKPEVQRFIEQHNLWHLLVVTFQ
jgi:hypothetical protein